MSDLIDRQQTAEYLCKYMEWVNDDYCFMDTDEKREVVEEMLSGIPSAEPKTGKWVITGKFADTIHAKCSECKRHQIFYYGKKPTNYCPECGASMTDDDHYCEHAKRRTDV